MKTFKEYVLEGFEINEAYKKVTVELGEDFHISKLGFDTNGNWSYMVDKGSLKPKKVQHQGNWDRKITKDDNNKDLSDSRIAKEIIEYYNKVFK